MGHGRKVLGESISVSLLCRASNSLRKVMQSGLAATGGLLAATTESVGTVVSVWVSWVLMIKAPVE